MLIRKGVVYKGNVKAGRCFDKTVDWMGWLDFSGSRGTGEPPHEHATDAHHPPHGKRKSRVNQLTMLMDID